MRISKDNKYRFDPDWYDRFAHTDINKVIDELDSIQESFGEISPKSIVECARNKKSVLHSFFEWDDSVAANKWRLQQARYLLSHIQVIVIEDGKEKVLKAYEIVKKGTLKSSGLIKKFDAITPENLEGIKSIVMGDLSRCATRLRNHQCFSDVVKIIDKARLALSNVNTKSTTETKEPEPPLAAVV